MLSPMDSHSGSALIKDRHPAIISPTLVVSRLETPEESQLVINAQDMKSRLYVVPDSYIPVGVLTKCDIESDNARDKASQDADFPEVELRILEGHSWIRTRPFAYKNNPGWSYVRVYVLPDDRCRELISRSSATLRRALKVIMSKVDISSDGWKGEFIREKITLKSAAEVFEDESLWYIFNTLENPKPDVKIIEDPFARRAVQHILHETSSTVALDEYPGVPGLKTPLYPYQCRSAATMIQREVQPASTLDPRLRSCRTPTGQEYYYDKEEGIILRERRLYSEACGGILAETMGCGKTLICLTVILATRGYFPRIPIQYQAVIHPVREMTGSLVDMAAATAGRFSLPWKSFFDQLKDAGANYERCVTACERNRGAYGIRPPSSRYKSRGKITSRSATYLRLCSGNIIVVPSNLVDHWRHEIDIHTEGLKVLIFRSSSDVTPSADELLQYDIVLFSRPRFERENENSPLKELHWLRIIVDEGHNVAGRGYKTNMIHFLDQIHVERRWVVSGTPSMGLYGVEVSLASQETQISDSDASNDTTSSVLQSRRIGISSDEELKDLDALRLIVVEFLKLRPWSNSRANDAANWTKYIKPLSENGHRRKASSLRATLQGLVVRHRLDVINCELPLPKLHNKVVFLKPTFYDKLTINLFVFLLAVNAITSERTDQDYMFHPKNRKHLSLLLNNLRQAGFWSTGFDRSILESTIETALKYLDKNHDRMTKEDIKSLHDGIRIAQKATDCKSWNAFHSFDELGIFVENFPQHAREQWALEPSLCQNEPLLLGISKARLAQKFITSNLMADDPTDGFAGAGIKAEREVYRRAERNTLELGAGTLKNAAEVSIHRLNPEPKSLKKTPSSGFTVELSCESPLARTKLVATSSAKLTYLLERVLELHQTEKIVIFYESNNTAFWIAEGLEILGIEFRIYASTLRAHQKAAYLSIFDESEEVRVLVMDLRQASHGLHVAGASRVFIVNPIWRPNVESQAIKRAHRIGQTKPVFVETLVLQGTLEDKMLRRRKEMSNAELQHAERDMLDDGKMAVTIQNERFIPMLGDEIMAGPSYLKDTPGLFDRHKLSIPDSRTVKQPNPITPSKRKRLDNIDFSWDGPDISGGVDMPRTAPRKQKLSFATAVVAGSSHGISSGTPELGLFDESNGTNDTLDSMEYHAAQNSFPGEMSAAVPNE